MLIFNIRNIINEHDRVPNQKADGILFEPKTDKGLISLLTPMQGQIFHKSVTTGVQLNLCKVTLSKLTT
jgi:hypothetical protein